MDTPGVITKDGPVPGSERIYRALNPKHFENGKPGDNHFLMSRRDPPNDGISTGIASKISIAEMRSIEAIRMRYGEVLAIADLFVAEVLMPVATLGISVVQQDAPIWGAFVGAHAVITGYQGLKGITNGKQKLNDFQHHLVRLARKRYYPANSDTPHYD